MQIVRNSSIALLFLAVGLSAFGQSPAPAEGSAGENKVTARRARLYSAGPPCWRQAGMTPDMVNQRWRLEEQQRTQIAQVCSEPSSSPQQKHDKIEQIHADTDRSLANLIPAKELAAFNRCQAALDQRRPKPAGQKELGPCGGVISTESADATTAPAHRHASTPNNQ